MMCFVWFIFTILVEAPLSAHYNEIHSLLKKAACKKEKEQFFQ